MRNKIFFIFVLVLLVAIPLAVADDGSGEEFDFGLYGNSPEGSMCIFVNVSSYGTPGTGGVVAQCPSGYTIMSGGWYFYINNMDKSIPQGNGWYCDYNNANRSQCWAVCCDKNYFQTTIVENNGSMYDGIFANCPEDYKIVGGGYKDVLNYTASDRKSDQDDNRAVDNGWYCRDDESNKTNSKCYAVCARSKKPEYTLACRKESGYDALIPAGVRNWATYTTVNCPEGYFVTGGGFNDPSKSNDDQDYSYPTGNSWYCNEDFNDDSAIPGTCYAQCCSLKLAECRDGKDNDCDGLIDMNDTGCADENDDSEKDVEVPQNVCMFVNVSSYGIPGEGGIVAQCPEGYTIMGGGWYFYGNNMDKNVPQDNGWYCEYNNYNTSSCWAVCCDNNYFQTTIVENNGNMHEGIFTECPEDYKIVGGGYNDILNYTALDIGSDQDDNRGVDNGWYCRDDESNLSGSACYAVCARSKNPEYEMECIAESGFGTITSSGSRNWVTEASASCPDGYFVTSGGFTDSSNSRDDEDYSYPRDNQWYCYEDFGDGFPIRPTHGLCYAQCCRLKPKGYDPPPVIEKELGEPKIECNGGCDWWITQDTVITINVYDTECGESGIDYCEYRYDVDGVEVLPWTEIVWTETWKDLANITHYRFNLSYQEDSNHFLEVRCYDLAGNEAYLSELDKVDSTPPATEKIYDDPHYPSAHSFPFWITTHTPITLDAQDGGPICAIGVEKTWYMDTLAPEEWCKYNQTDNNGSDRRWCMPVCLSPYENPNNVNCIETAQNYCDDNWQQTGSWEKCVENYVYDVCKIDCGWPDETNSTQWRLYNGTPIYKKEDSCHILEYFSVDMLGNVEPLDYQCFYVDDRPPVTNKTYGIPYFEIDGAEWISNKTEIYLSANDSQPHPSGVNETNYRVTLVGDENCWDDENCQEISGDGSRIKYHGHFHITEELCHLIEYYSTDNLDNMEEVRKQCVFVNDGGSEPNKTVGDPKAFWNGVDAYFYNITEFCAQDENCWKVTLDTPIYMECIPPAEHVCFRVELDAKDNTTTYCQNYNGTMDDGYCCINYGADFYFKEESEHNFAYYCKNEQGTGETDDEKFKVEGRKFEIQLNTKWNLISTPVIPLNASFSAIFENSECDVMSVWTYDAVTGLWHVYTPDGNDMNDDLDTMVPGDGYWVLANNSCIFSLGGSLLKPGPVDQVKKKIVPGYNLIGYYGTENLTGYYGPAGAGKTAYCALYSLGPTIWDKEFTSIWGYWEPWNSDSWIPLNNTGHMDPGAGYWMITTASGLYTPSTNC